MDFYNGDIACDIYPQMCHFFWTCPGLLISKLTRMFIVCLDTDSTVFGIMQHVYKSISKHQMLKDTYC